MRSLLAEPFLRSGIVNIVNACDDLWSVSSPPSERGRPDTPGFDVHEAFKNGDIAMAMNLLFRPTRSLWTSTGSL